MHTNLFVVLLLGLISTLMISVAYSDIPLFLHNDAFYRSLSADEPNSAIEVPGDCFTTSTSVETVTDFARFLRIANFWMLEKLPESVFRYVHLHSFHEWKKEAREILERSAQAELWEMLQDVFFDPGEDWSAAVKYERPDLMEYLATSPPRDCEATKHVAAAGQLDLLVVLRASNHPWDSELYLHAARHTDCCVYAHQQGLPWHQETAEAFSQHGDLPLLNYAAAYGVKFRSQDIATAAAAGNLAALTFLIESGLRIPEDACTKAAQQGHVECLRVLHQHHAEWNWHTLYGAAFYKRIDAVRFLHEHGCVWSHSVIETAAGSGCLAVLRYALDNGCPFNEGTVLQRAASACGGSLACLQYLIDEKHIVMNADGSVL